MTLYTPLSGLKWPETDDCLLLEVILCDDESALGAWQQWRVHNDLDSLSPAAFQLIPSVYLRLQSLEYQDEWTKKMGGIYRQTWTKNQFARLKLEATQRALKENGIQSILAQGLPLSLIAEQNNRVRLIHDADIVISKCDLARAIALMQQEDWTPKSKLLPDELTHFAKEQRFSGSKWLEVDLQWRPYCYDTPDQVENDFCGSARTIVHSEQEFTIPAPEHCLMLACINARRREIHATHYWVIDLINILTLHACDIDWPVLANSLKNNTLLLPVRDCLTWLAAFQQNSVPGEALRSLWNIETDRSAAQAYEELLRENRTDRGVKETLRHHKWRYTACNKAGKVAKPGLSLPNYVGKYYYHHWNLGSPLMMPARVIQHVGSNLIRNRNK